MADPPGVPVGQALRLRPLVPDPRGLTKHVAAAITAIDKVHGGGVLLLTPIEWDVLDPGVEAALEFDRFGGTVEVPLRIVVSTVVRRAGLALLYEVGHLLDHQAIGDAGHFASDDPSFLNRWRQAVTASHAVEQLEGIRLAGRSDPVAAHMEYLLRPRELWERSYAQYVAIRGGAPNLAREMAEVRTRRDLLYIPYLWDDDDFEPIASAIDDHFRELGWIT